VRSARVARLATHNPSGAIDVVPITFAVGADDTIVSAVDHKPKRTTKLQRLENIRREPGVTLLIDHYEDDWSELWWVRVRGVAEVVDEPPSALLDPLIQKYEQYQTHPPTGPALVITVTDLRSWSAVGDYRTT
jgi:PPOX class probable F420-dependent enzyme